MDHIETLIAIEGIKTLKARYFRFVDTQDWDGLRALFTDDAVLEFQESMSEPCSIDGFMTLVQNMLAGATSVHHGHMPEIEILSADTARAIWAMTDLIVLPHRRGSLDAVEMVRGSGHYHETYVRTADGWRIRTLRLSRLRLEKAVTSSFA